MPFEIILDGLVALLLCATIVYSFTLNKKLDALRSGKDELRELIKMLSENVSRAQSSVAQLKISGDKAASELNESISAARQLSDELELMLQSGNNLANRITNSVTTATRMHTSSDHEEDIIAAIQKVR